MEHVEVFLYSDSAGEVPAVLREMDPASDLQSWKNHWQPLLQKSHEEDRHWDWINKYAKNAHVNFEYYVIECDGMIQGMTMIETDFHRSKKKKNLVYVDFLSIAPWNRKNFVKEPKYKRTGSILIYAAVRRSEQLGYRYRIGLHSLPGAIDFYVRIGMRDYGPDPQYQNLHYLEFDETSGKDFVQK